jgi:hypothetical protein
MAREVLSTMPKKEPFMEMLLMGACLAIFGLAVTCLTFKAAMPGEEEAQQPQPEKAKAAVAVPARFFADPVIVPLVAAQEVKVPIEALLLEIENHVRLEHAAAESFLAAPTPLLLHSRTTSRLVN